MIDKAKLWVTENKVTAASIAGGVIAFLILLDAIT